MLHIVECGVSVVFISQGLSGTSVQWMRNGSTLLYMVLDESLGLGFLEVFMKKNRALLIISLLLNLALLGCTIYIGGVKTNFFQRIGTRLGICKTIPKERGDYWCIQGWNNSFLKLGVDFDVVFLGNSITRGSDFREYFPSTSICNLGYPGDNMDGMMLRIPSVQGVHPKKVFVMAGINGLHMQPKKVFIEKYENLATALCDSLPNTQIYFQSILPVNNNDFGKYVCDNEKIKWANTEIEHIAASHNCGYIDLFSVLAVNDELPKEISRDGVHLLPEAYDKWAKAIEPFVEP